MDEVLVGFGECGNTYGITTGPALKRRRLRKRKKSPLAGGRKRRRDALLEQCAGVVEQIKKEKARAAFVDATTVRCAAALRTELPCLTGGDLVTTRRRKPAVDITADLSAAVPSLPPLSNLSAEGTRFTGPRRRRGGSPKSSLHLSELLNEKPQKDAAGGRGRGSCAGPCGDPRGPHVPAGLRPSQLYAGLGGQYGYPRARPTMRLYRQGLGECPFYIGCGESVFRSAIVWCDEQIGKARRPRPPDGTSASDSAGAMAPKPYVSVFSTAAAAAALRAGESCVETRPQRVPAPPPRRAVCVGDWTQPPKRVHPAPPRSPAAQQPVPLMPAPPRHLRGAAEGRAQAVSGSHNVLPGERGRASPAVMRPVLLADHRGGRVLSPPPPPP